MQRAKSQTKLTLLPYKASYQSLQFFTGIAGIAPGVRMSSGYLLGNSREAPHERQQSLIQAIPSTIRKISVSAGNTGHNAGSCRTGKTEALYIGGPRPCKYIADFRFTIGPARPGDGQHVQGKKGRKFRGIQAVVQD